MFIHKKMKATIFSRLVIGFIAILFLAMTVSIYSIFQLSHLENVTKSIISVDNQLMAHQQKMLDYILTMMRYERKFIIIKDESLFKHFFLTKNNFDKQLKDATALADSSEAVDILNTIRNGYHHYQDLFNEEVAHIRSGNQYSVNLFGQKKEAAVNGVIDGLENLSDYIKTGTYNKVNKLGKAEVNASKVAITMGSVSLVFGIIISIYLTYTITSPLSLIKKKTKEIARGDFGNDLELSAPPEIEELAHAFNSMCAKLKEIDKLKSDFFSLMSHELRTPLTTIKEGTNIFLEGLEEGEATKKQKKLMTIINEESIRLINLVNSLLDLSKVEAGMMVYNFTQADITLLIKKVTREIEPLSMTKKITVKTEIQDGLPLVKMDSDRILHVLRNLLGNALKFTEDGGQVAMSAEADNKVLKVSVSDTGRGISKDDLNSIFEKYHKVNAKDKGTGLGLFIVKHFIDAHGGKVWVEETSTQGTTFSFALPL